MSQSLGRDRARPFSGDLCEDPKFRDLAEDSLVERSLFRRRRSQPPQVLETVNPSVVSIVPARLQGVTADDDETVELKAGVGMSDFWSQNIAEHIRFATASCARTCATE
jgi:predicted component of type VI protein secretion system